MIYIVIYIYKCTNNLRNQKRIGRVRNSGTTHSPSLSCLFTSASLFRRKLTIESCPPVLAACSAVLKHTQEYNSPFPLVAIHSA